MLSADQLLDMEARYESAMNWEQERSRPRKINPLFVKKGRKLYPTTRAMRTYWLCKAQGMYHKNIATRLGITPRSLYAMIDDGRFGLNETRPKRPRRNK